MKRKELHNILFLDIETVSSKPSFESLNPREQLLWKTKTKSFSRHRKPLIGNKLKESYLLRAGIYAEFAKIVCITVSYIQTENDKSDNLRVKSFYGNDEKVLITQFVKLINQFYFNPKIHFLSGHNIKEFDVPFLARRMIVNEIRLPKLFQISGKKPWQINYLIDTLDLWRFGDFKNHTSLDLLANTLGIESPKSDLDGSQVSKVYYQDNDLPRIVRYCEKDVQTTVQVLLKLKGLEAIASNKIESLTDWEQ